ncbi:hypothetical protein [Donghicola mangrovi]|uniref:Uncharacterized protein n=1 Tax=Donghicola mangrovi TaxID=2729614 RepID=A0A850QGF4_9RHOB|nr:hypothetical protein [Donghicola mangrovi]NVO24921.1 hypothetical protein [Donghicola mangrovi]
MKYIRIIQNFYVAILMVLSVASLVIAQPERALLLAHGSMLPIVDVFVAIITTTVYGFLFLPTILFRTKLAATLSSAAIMIVAFGPRLAAEYEIYSETAVLQENDQLPTEIAEGPKVVDLYMISDRDVIRALLETPTVEIVRFRNKYNSRDIYYKTETGGIGKIHDPDPDYFGAADMAVKSSNESFFDIVFNAGVDPGGLGRLYSGSRISVIGGSVDQQETASVLFQRTSTVYEVPKVPTRFTPIFRGLIRGNNGGIEVSRFRRLQSDYSFGDLLAALAEIGLDIPEHHLD